MTAPGHEAQPRWPVWKRVVFVVLGLGLPLPPLLLVNLIERGRLTLGLRSDVLFYDTDAAFLIHLGLPSLLVAWLSRYGLRKRGWREVVWYSALIPYCTACAYLVSAPVTALLGISTPGWGSWGLLIGMVLVAPLLLLPAVPALAVAWTPLVLLLRCFAPPPKDQPDRLRQKLAELRKKRYAREQLRFSKLPPS